MDTSGLGSLGAFTSQRVQQPATISEETQRRAKGLRVKKAKNVDSKERQIKGDTKALVRSLKKDA